MTNEKVLTVALIGLMIGKLQAKVILPTCVRERLHHLAAEAPVTRSHFRLDGYDALVFVR